ncbi:MAG TPA: hypothetical protein PLD54_03405 [Candidatus Levybacteria bacterium]|nr:hypothetical protein [Candidatus Levybacteria bacterium]
MFFYTEQILVRYGIGYAVLYRYRNDGVYTPYRGQDGKVLKYSSEEDAIEAHACPDFADCPWMFFGRPDMQSRVYDDQQLVYGPVLAISSWEEEMKIEA